MSTIKLSSQPEVSVLPPSSGQIILFQDSGVLKSKNSANVVSIYDTATIVPASNTEADTGTDTVKYITPASLKHVTDQIIAGETGAQLVFAVGAGFTPNGIDVFNSWDTFYAVANATNLPKIVLISGALTTTATTYVVGKMKLIGLDQAPVIITCPDGTILTCSDKTVLDNVQFTGSSNTIDLFQSTNGKLVCENEAGVNFSGTAFAFSGSGSIEVINGGGIHNIEAIAPGAIGVILGLGGSIGSYSGDGDITVALDAGSNFGGAVSYTGTAVVPFLSDAATLMSYDNSSSGLSSITIKTALDELAGRKSAVFPEYYLSTGATPNGATVFSSWASFYAVASLVPGKKFVYLGDAIPVSIATNPIVWDDYEFIGLQPNGQAGLICDTDVTGTLGGLLVLNNCILTGNSATSSLIVASGTAACILTKASINFGGGKFAISGVGDITAYNSAIGPVEANGGNLGFRLYIDSSLGDYSGSGDIIVYLDASSSNVGNPVSYTGSVVALGMLDNSSAITYNNVTSGLVSTIVKEAIDELAAAAIRTTLIASGATYTVPFLNSIVLVDPGVTSSVILPNNAGSIGRDVLIADSTGTSFATPITISVASGGTINGAPTVTIATPLQTKTIECGAAGVYGVVGEFPNNALDIFADNTTSGLSTQVVQLQLDELASTREKIYKYTVTAADFAGAAPGDNTFIGGTPIIVVPAGEELLYVKYYLNSPFIVTLGTTAAINLGYTDTSGATGTTNAECLQGIGLDSNAIGFKGAFIDRAILGNGENVLSNSISTGFTLQFTLGMLTFADITQYGNLDIWIVTQKLA